MSNEYLERIAIALESIDTKTSAFVTWDELLEDLENTLGVGHFLTRMIDAFLDMFPSLRLKVDATDLVGKVFEYYSFRLPILTLLGTIASALTISAASSVAQKGIDIYRAVLATLDTASFVANGWREFIFGEWSIYTDFLKPLLDRFFSDAEGGDGGVDPDNDPQLRPIVNLANNIRAVANATITCNQCGAAAGSCGHIGNGPIIDPPEAEGQPDLETPPPTWEGTTPAYSQYKCDAATLLADSYLAYVQRYSEISGIIETLGAFGLFTGLSGVFPTLLSILYTTVLWAYLVTISALALPLLALLSTYKSNLEDTKEQFVCDLLGALTVDAARDVISAWISDNRPVDIPDSWDQLHLNNLFPSTVINILFEEYGPAVGYGANCEECEPCAEIWHFTEDMDGFAVGNTLPDCMDSYLNLTGSASVAQPDLGQMQWTTGSGAGTSNGLVQKTGLAIDLGDTPQVELSGTTSLSAMYIDCAMVASDGTCESHTIDNNWNSGETQTITVDYPNLAGKTLAGLYFMMIGQSNNNQSRLTVDYVIVHCE